MRLLQVAEASIVDLRLDGSFLVEGDSVYGQNPACNQQSASDKLSLIASQAVRCIPNQFSFQMHLNDDTEQRVLDLFSPCLASEIQAEHSSEIYKACCGTFCLPKCPNPPSSMYDKAVFALISDLLSSL